MPRKPRKTQQRRTPVRIRILVAILLIILVAGIAAVKYFESVRGKVVLTDAGFTVYYSEVQQAIDDDLRVVLRRYNLLENLEETVQAIGINRQSVHVRRWETSCRSNCSLVKINVALTRTVRHRGAVVRSSREEDAGNILVIEVGSRKYPTHRIVIRKRDARESEVEGAEREPRIALVIDDFGYSRGRVAERFLDVDLPLTISVLPMLPYSLRTLNRAKKANKHVILHLPMEADNGETVDMDAVMTAMNDPEIRKLVNRYLAELPGVEGVNNHMGSKATRDRRVMEAVLGVLRERGLYFLDSLTSPESIAYTTAKALGVPTARNSIFLDAGTEDPAVVARRLEQLTEVARRHGHAVGIGHPKPWTYEAIERYAAGMSDSGVRLVFLRDILE
jgi:polysaccharide deacetylase 2 family uncharacterized protein YibQ